MQRPVILLGLNFLCTVRSPIINSSVTSDSGASESELCIWKFQLVTHLPGRLWALLKNYNGLSVPGIINSHASMAGLVT